MKPSNRFETYVIVGIGILGASLAFLPPSVLRRAGDPDDLHFFGWFMLTGLCLAAIGVIREQANRRKNKWLLLFGVLPLAVLSYEAWYVTKLTTLAIIREWRGFVGLSWVLLTIYLWYRGNDYREQAETANSILHKQPSRCPHCGAHL